MTGEELKAQRKAMAMSQGGLAEALGLTGTFIGMMERGVKPIERRTILAVRYLAGAAGTDTAPTRPHDRNTDVQEEQDVLEALAAAKDALARMREGGPQGPEQTAKLRRHCIAVLGEITAFLADQEAAAG
ncbi:helix-turn-helix domain-containing protein [Sphingosinicella sp. BN140058]|uniref:helix-turn-helix domain-containing protein n=1 Tax=Sphingosinicella sp. BN140058 TaxID=1892855 RepID=UPI001011292E|nr:helix-turn-helix transcriptional regulator [Sphingosinicella sp. BN140058]QAY78689.1 XRE family transcriptional regulator [Sphingosinicella sp. BN140058]